MNNKSKIISSDENKYIYLKKLVFYSIAHPKKKKKTICLRLKRRKHYMALLNIENVSTFVYLSSTP
jgi:hypothetical protein